MYEDKKSCITINCGCCGNGNSNDNGNDSTPVGTVISYVGTSAPKHYLICDGTVYNIDDYKKFSQFIKDEHGSFDFFGGDGTTTFAVPDLRGEFLRGTGAATRNTGSGAIVGTHQDPTEHLNVMVDTAPHIFMQGNRGLANTPKNIDKMIISSNKTGWTNLANTDSWAGSGETGYYSRPTNTAVLYCIKYE